MDTRANKLLQKRVAIVKAMVTKTMSTEEQFQNKTLRPVIHQQNDLIVAVFKNYINKHKGHFYTLSIEKQLQYIENAIQRDIKFRNSLKGIVIGQFTLEEYAEYIKNSSAINKRMMRIVIERLKDQLQLLATTVREDVIL